MSVYCLPDFALTKVPRPTLPAWIVGEGRLRSARRRCTTMAKKKKKTEPLWSFYFDLRGDTLTTQHFSLPISPYVPTSPHAACCMKLQERRLGTSQTLAWIWWGPLLEFTNFYASETHPSLLRRRSLGLSCHVPRRGRRIVWRAQRESA